MKFEVFIVLLWIGSILIIAGACLIENYLSYRKQENKLKDKFKKTDEYKDKE